MRLAQLKRRKAGKARRNVKHPKRRTIARGLGSSIAKPQQQLDRHTEKSIKTSKELGSVLQAMMKDALKLGKAKFGSLMHYDADTLYPAVELDLPEALAEFRRRRGPFRPSPGSPFHRAIKTRRFMQTDAAQDPMNMPAKLAQARSYIAIPMTKGKEVVGIIAIYRLELRPFTDKQVQALTKLASRAVAATENGGLRSELRHRPATR
jgi:GAF domain-containing protein